MATSTRVVRFDRLKLKGKDAAIVVKLMMACNDLSIANQALDDWKNTTDRARRDRKVGACMYFVRLQLSHLYEALEVIKEVEETPTLRALVDRCDTRARDSYTEVLAYTRGKANYNRFQQLVGGMRSSLTFHYEEGSRMILWAIADRAQRNDGKVSTITRADTAHRWRFSVADDIVDSIVVRRFWKIPREADLRTEADKILDEVHAVTMRFADFCGEFIWEYCSD
jgi:hypothetical protein